MRKRRRHSEPVAMLGLNSGQFESIAQTLLTLSLWSLDLESDHQDWHPSSAISCLRHWENLVPSLGLCAKSGWSCQLPWPEWENGAGNNPRLSRPQSFHCSSQWVSHKAEEKQNFCSCYANSSTSWCIQLWTLGTGEWGGEKVHTSSIYPTHTRQPRLVKRLFLSQEPITKAGGSSYPCWEKQGTGTCSEALKDDENENQIPQGYGRE